MRRRGQPGGRSPAGARTAATRHHRRRPKASRRRSAPPSTLGRHRAAPVGTAPAAEAIDPSRFGTSTSIAPGDRSALAGRRPGELRCAGLDIHVRAVPSRRACPIDLTARLLRCSRPRSAVLVWLRRRLFSRSPTTRWCSTARPRRVSQCTEWPLRPAPARSRTTRSRSPSATPGLPGKFPAAMCRSARSRMSRRRSRTRHNDPRPTVWRCASRRRSPRCQMRTRCVHVVPVQYASLRLSLMSR